MEPNISMTPSEDLNRNRKRSFVSTEMKNDYEEQPDNKRRKMSNNQQLTVNNDILEICDDGIEKTEEVKGIHNDVNLMYELSDDDKEEADSIHLDYIPTVVEMQKKYGKKEYITINDYLKTPVKF